MKGQWLTWGVWVSLLLVLIVVILIVAVNSAFVKDLFGFSQKISGDIDKSCEEIAVERSEEFKINFGNELVLSRTECSQVAEENKAKAFYAVQSSELSAGSLCCFYETIK